MEEWRITLSQGSGDKGHDPALYDEQAEPEQGRGTSEQQLPAGDKVQVSTVSS